MGRRKSESMFDIAIESAWPVSATFAVLILVFGYIVFPIMAQGNPILSSMTQSLKPFVLLFSGLFGLIALIKWIAASMRSPKKTHVDFSQRIQPTIRTPKTGGSSVPIKADIPYEPAIHSVPSAIRADEWSLE